MMKYSLSFIFLSILSIFVSNQLRLLPSIVPIEYLFPSPIINLLLQTNTLSDHFECNIGRGDPGFLKHYPAFSAGLAESFDTHWLEHLKQMPIIQQ